MFRPTATSQVVTAANGDSGLIKNVILRFDIEVLSRREPVLIDIQTGRATPQDDKSIGFSIRKWSKKQGVHDTEDGAVSSYANGKRDYSDDSKCRMLEKHSHRKGNVMQKIFHSAQMMPFFLSSAMRSHE